MKNKKHLNFYRQCLRMGKMPTTGLCYAAIDKHISTGILDDMSPTERDKIVLLNKGYNTGYWGSDSKFARKERFTKLRQNIVLLMAAVNGEL